MRGKGKGVRRCLGIVTVLIEGKLTKNHLPCVRLAMNGGTDEMLSIIFRHCEAGFFV